MVDRYPSEIKAFYFQPDEQRPEVALGVDVIAPEGYGEIIGGGQRIHDLALLEARLDAHQLPREAFNWYLDLRRFGTVPHGGFGMGVERFVAWMCGLEHIRETIPYPRMLYRTRLEAGCIVPGLSPHGHEASGSGSALASEARPASPDTPGVTDRPVSFRLKEVPRDVMMTVTLDLPPQVEQAYLAAAQARGLALSDIVRETLLAAQPSATAIDSIAYLQETDPKEWARQFHAWAESHDRTTPLLSDEAISRENIYPDRI